MDWRTLLLPRNGGKIDKDIYNAYDDNIRLQTQAIDYSRISDVS